MFNYVLLSVLSVYDTSILIYYYTILFIDLANKNEVYWKLNPICLGK